MLNIKVLGSGCANCKNLENLCREAVAENGIGAEIEKVTDFKDIMSYGILATPGLVINGKVVSSGKIPAKATITHWIMDAAAESETR